MRGAVIGNYAEASPDVHDMLTLASNGVAKRTWRRLGRRSEAEARSSTAAAVRRRFGTIAARAFARHRLRRIGFIGMPRAVLDARLQQLGGGAIAGELPPAWTVHELGVAPGAGAAA